MSTSLTEIDELAIDKRFRWEDVNGKMILHVDISYALGEELIAIIYRLSHYENHFPDTVKKAYLLVRNKQSTPEIKVFKHLIFYAKKCNFFEKSAYYGYIAPIGTAAIKVINPYLKHKVKLFKTQKEALDFLLT